MVRSISTGACARAAAALVLAVSGLLAGCADTRVEEARPVDGPAFSGPWAAEFRSYFDDAASDFERGVLADGEITDQEYSEMTDRFSGCLEAAGFDFSGFGRDGSYSATPLSPVDPDTSRQVTDDCGVESGERTIGALYTWITRNPENVDEASIVVDCLHRKGLVDAGYTAEDWTRENAVSSLPASIPADRKGEYEECAGDPLGLVDG
ncbi:hypothetical protein GSU69_00600 [Rathayibacter festucae]|uniref:Lipoprotein n=1 Tax=Rathayibacter festucae TaxID=110937 RepID=A0ABX6GV16_9MICO|nr:hypothetical protein [Rathayibacter festucae]QHC61351.1 hypothetical protein GSU69_00600 [Rathayibacter festucae]